MSGTFTPGKASTTPDPDKDFWGTQWECFNDAQALYGRSFTLDVAAEATTAKCLDYYSLERGQDSLLLPWRNDWWCNPPFSTRLEFVAKAREQQDAGLEGMMLLPYEPASNWWHDYLAEDVVIFEPDGRYNFLMRDGVTKKAGVNFPVAFVAFTRFRIGRSLRIPFVRGNSQRSPEPRQVKPVKSRKGKSVSTNDNFEGLL